MKKSTILCLLLTLMVSMLTAQSTRSITESRNDIVVQADNEKSAIETSKASILSLRQMWVNGSVVWNLDESAPIESPAVLGRILFTPYETERFALPILGNIRLNDSGGIETPDDGVSIGAYPWVLLKTSDAFGLTAHGGVGYRRYSDSLQVDQTEIKMLAGLEVEFGAPGGLPTIISVAPVYRLGQGDLPNTTTLEVVGVLPMGNGFSLMGQGNFPLDGSNGDLNDSLFRLGILLSTGL